MVENFASQKEIKAHRDFMKKKKESMTEQKKEAAASNMEVYRAADTETGEKKENINPDENYNENMAAIHQAEAALSSTNKNEVIEAYDIFEKYLNEKDLDPRADTYAWDIEARLRKHRNKL